MKWRDQLLSSIIYLPPPPLDIQKKEEEETFESVPKRYCSPYYTFQRFFHVGFIEGCEFRPMTDRRLGKKEDELEILQSIEMINMSGWLCSYPRCII